MNNFIQAGHCLSFVFNCLAHEKNVSHLLDNDWNDSNFNANF